MHCTPLPWLLQWKSYQEVNAEVEGFYGEWQREKEDLLDSLRLLHHQMQLKNMVIDAFIPAEELQKVQPAPGQGRGLRMAGAEGCAWHVTSRVL